MTLTVYGRPLVAVPDLKYMGQALLASRNNWLAAVHNISKARSKWVGLSRVLGREGSDARTLGMFYVTVVYAVLLHGLEMWVMYPHNGRMLGGFHHWVA